MSIDKKEKKTLKETKDDVYDFISKMTDFISSKDLLDLTYYIWLRTKIERKNKFTKISNL